jgi:hypothetical protein
MNDKPTPRLVVESLGGKNLGRCYNATYFKIKSLNRPLSDSDITALRDMGWLGYGQEFSFKRVENEQFDSCNKFFVVLAESRVDSSD